MRRAGVVLAVWLGLLFASPASARAQANVQTVESFSASVGRTTKYNIVVPRSDGSSERRYPVLYLLHGLSAARAFIKVLLDNDIPFDFMQMPGGHNPGFGTQAIGHSMSIQDEVMQRALGRRPVAERR